jgi:hypothetical protein
LPRCPQRSKATLIVDDPCCDRVPIDGDDQTGAVRRFGVQGFTVLWRHETVPAASLTDDPTVIPSMLKAGRLEVDGDGTLVAVHGLAARSTPHRIEHPDGVIHTWCALDAIGIPAALGVDATAITTCPACDSELRVRLDRGTPVDDESLVLWLPDAACDHLVDDFCANANLYCSRDHLASSVTATTAGRPITVTDVAAIGRQTWADASKELHP